MRGGLISGQTSKNVAILAASRSLRTLALLPLIAVPPYRLTYSWNRLQRRPVQATASQAPYGVMNRVARSTQVSVM